MSRIIGFFVMLAVLIGGYTIGSAGAAVGLGALAGLGVVPLTTELLVVAPFTGAIVAAVMFRRVRS